MLDFGWSEIAIVVVVALLVVGPKDLPKVLRAVRYWIGKARAMAREFQDGVDDLVREAELKELKAEVEDATRDQLSGELDDFTDPTGNVIGQPEDDVRPPERKEVPAADAAQAEPTDGDAAKGAAKPTDGDKPPSAAKPAEPDGGKAAPAAEAAKAAPAKPTDGDKPPSAAKPAEPDGGKAAPAAEAAKAAPAKPDGGTQAAAEPATRDDQPATPPDGGPAEPKSGAQPTRRKPVARAGGAASASGR